MTSALRRNRCGAVSRRRAANAPGRHADAWTAVEQGQAARLPAAEPVGVQEPGGEVEMLTRLQFGRAEHVVERAGHAGQLGRAALPAEMRTGQRAVDDGAALREDHDAGREHDERRDQDDTRRDTDSGDERHDQAGQEPERPEPEDAQDRDDVPVRARAPEEQAGVGDVVQQRPEPVPDLVRAGLPEVHLLRHDPVGDRTARHRRDGADIAVPARVGQVQQQASRPHRRAVPATGQGNANSGHGSPLRHQSAWSLPGTPSTPPARSARLRGEARSPAAAAASSSAWADQCRTCEIA